MLTFLLAFFHRSLSGVQSMFGYAHNKIGLILISILMCVYPLLFSEPSFLLYLFIFVNFITVFMKMTSFSLTPKLNILKKYNDIHLWENLVTGGYVTYLTFAGHNVLLLMCSVYPALLLHKGLINIGSKLPFFATETDDPTGETYGFKLFGLKIKRSSNIIRIVSAILSIIFLYLILHYGWSISA